MYNLNIFENSSLFNLPVLLISYISNINFIFSSAEPFRNITNISTNSRNDMKPFLSLSTRWNICKFNLLIFLTYLWHIRANIYVIFRSLSRMSPSLRTLRQVSYSELPQILWWSTQCKLLLAPLLNLFVRFLPLYARYEMPEDISCITSLDKF